MKYQELTIKQKALITLTLTILVLNTLYFIFYAKTVHASEPASANYKLQDYSFGSGGTNNSASSNYKINGVAGEVEFGRPGSTNYKTGSGLTYMMQANVPGAPTFTNPANYYNKLKLVLNTGANSTDTQYAIAISKDNFVSNFQYIQTDTTVGNSPIWQDYPSWGGASGTTIIGLTPGITYTVKVLARQGSFTQSAFSPTAQAATINPTLSFSISPNTVNIGQLTPGNITTSSTHVTVTLSTNGTGGGIVYIYGTNGGLLSSSTNYMISAVSSDLSSTNEGYGIQGVSVSQSSGGPMKLISPYNGIGDNVGTIDTTKRQLFDSSSQPITSGQGVFELKARPSLTAKAAPDYTDTLTVIASAAF